MFGQVRAQTAELQPRSGLHSFLEKVDFKDTVRVAYLGGSITEAPGWRISSFDYLQELFPQTVIIQIPAAIGGTGSEFGAYRLAEDVLVHKPDLVFVEFAVNDNGLAEDKIIQSMEGIVRQIKEHDVHTDICFIYTIVEGFLPLEKSGLLPVSKTAMEKVADHYDIPSINFGFEVSKRVEEGSLIFTGKSSMIEGTPVFSSDRVHPYIETGHKIYGTVFQRAFDDLVSEAIMLSRPLPEPLHPQPLMRAKSYPVDPRYLSGEWHTLDLGNSETLGKFSNTLPKIYSPADEYAQLQISFTGTSIGFVDIIGPDSGALIVEIDGKQTLKIDRFDEYSTFKRISYKMINDLEDGPHQITFRLDTERMDKSGILSKRNNVMSDPADYKDQNWYLGKILVNGEIR